MDKLIQVFRSVFHITDEELRDDLSPNQIEAWDSLTHLEMVSELEDIFDIEFEIDHISEMQTVGDIIKILREYGVDVNEGFIS